MTSKTISLCVRLLIALLTVSSGSLFAQVTTTINATGTTGSFKTGSVNSAGVKNDGDLVVINTTTNRGWAVFDMTTIPSGATIISANIIFTTFSSVNSTATNTIRGITDNPQTTAGATLYANIGSGVTLNSSSWVANTASTKAVTAAGITFLQSRIGNPVTVGFVRGSTNQYNIYGYPNSATLQPQLEITYTLPMPPCTGTPNVATVVGPGFACPGETISLSLSGQTIASNLTYQWQSRPAGIGTYTNIAGATNDNYSSTITASTDYRCIITCTNSGQSATAAAHTINVGSFYTCYCKTNIGGGSTASIDSVSIEGTTLHNVSVGTAPSFYTQYPATNNTTANIQAGGLYTLHVKYGSSAIGSAWLDINQNGIFESVEWVQINSSGTEGVVTVQIPSNAPLGLTGMRIRSANAGSTNGATNACTNMSSGETEDYIINIVPAPVNDVRVVRLLGIMDGSSLCPYIDFPIRAVIYNNGSASQTNFPILSNLTGAAGGVSSFQYTGTLAPFTLDTVLLSTYNFQLVSNHTLVAHTSLSNDVNPNNDSSKIYSFDVKFAASAPLPINDSVCFGEDAIIGVRGDTLEHKWYDNPLGGSPVFIGDSIKFTNIQAGQTFYVSSQEPFTPAANGSLTTTSVGGNGCSGGAMFDVLPNLDLQVVSFEALFSSTGSQSVTVHYRQGTFAGNETNSAAWTVLGSTTVNVTSTTTLTPFTVNVPLPMTAGNTYGIYVEYNASYTNGTTTYTNAEMSIQTGTGLCSPFGGTNAGRMFNGTVVYTAGSAITTCESPLTPVTVFVDNPPIVNLGQDIIACEDLPIILDAGNAGGSYVWSTGSVSQTIDVSKKPGKYWVEVDKYCVASDTITVQLDPLPKLTGINFVRIGNGYQYSVANLQFADRVLWLFGDGSSDTAKSPYHVYATNGSYLVTLIAYNQCGSDSIQIMIPLSINEIDVNAAVKVYPNPATDKLFIDIADDVKVTGITIVNVMGNVVSKEAIANHKQIVQMDISNLPVGNYMLRMDTDKGILNKKIVILR